MLNKKQKELYPYYVERQRIIKDKCSHYVSGEYSYAGIGKKLWVTKQSIMIRIISLEKTLKSIKS